MNVSDLTVEDLKQLIAEIVREQLRQLLTDPDVGLALLPEVEDRLEASLHSTERIPLADVKRQLGPS